jgi:hypothetical protein
MVEIVIAAMMFFFAAANGEAALLVCEGVEYHYGQNDTEGRARELAVEIGWQHIRFAGREQHDTEHLYRFRSNENQCRQLGATCFEEGQTIVHQVESRSLSVRPQISMIENRFNQSTLRFEQRYFVDLNGNTTFERTEVATLFEASCVNHPDPFLPPD